MPASAPASSNNATISGDSGADDPLHACISGVDRSWPATLFTSAPRASNWRHSVPCPPFAAPAIAAAS
jgi:hypothetical protein